MVYIKRFFTVLVLVLSASVLVACSSKENNSSNEASQYEIALVNSINGEVFKDSLRDPHGHKFIYYYNEQFDKKRVFIKRDNKWYRYDLHNSHRVSQPYEGFVNIQKLKNHEILMSDNTTKKFVISGNLKRVLNMLKQE